MISTAQTSRLLLIRNGVQNSIVRSPIPRLINGSMWWTRLKPGVCCNHLAALLWNLTASPSQIPSSSALVEWADQTLTALDLSADGLVPWSPTTASSLLDPLISLGFEGLGLARRTT